MPQGLFHHGDDVGFFGALFQIQTGLHQAAVEIGLHLLEFIIIKQVDMEKYGGLADGLFLGVKRHTHRQIAILQDLMQALVTLTKQGHQTGSMDPHAGDVDLTGDGGVVPLQLDDGAVVRHQTVGHAAGFGKVRMFPNMAGLSVDRNGTFGAHPIVQRF